MVKENDIQWYTLDYIDQYVEVGDWIIGGQRYGGVFIGQVKEFIHEGERGYLRVVEHRHCEHKLLIEGEGVWFMKIPNFDIRSETNSDTGYCMNAWVRNKLQPMQTACDALKILKKMRSESEDPSKQEKILEKLLDMTDLFQETIDQLTTIE